MKFNVKMINTIPNAAWFDKQVRFGTSKGLNDTAKEAVTAVQRSLESTFIIRNKWPYIGPLAIKRDSATKAKLQAVVKTSADFLKQHEEGSTRSGRGHRIGVPLWGARPRGSKKILRTALRPRALLAAGKAFILKTPHGEIIATMRGRGASARIIPLYGLEPKVRVKKVSVFYDPIEKVVKRDLHKNIRDGIAYAFKTAR